MKGYVWCTYRHWSFRILEALQDIEGWRTCAIVTTSDCEYDFSIFEKRGIPVLRVDPKKDLKAGGSAYLKIVEFRPDAIFHYGWSWLVPSEVLALCPNVTLHPGKLPGDRGGSPIQNQIRNGEEWTYANLLELVPELDAGPVYLKERVSLAGESADDVWARMIASGTRVTDHFLRRLGDSDFRAIPQENPGNAVTYRRVTPEMGEIRVGSEQTAFQIRNIVRAHSESDPNTYVRPAYIELKGRRLIVERASLVRESSGSAKGSRILRNASELEDVEWIDFCAEVNNGTAELILEDRTGARVSLTRIYLGY